MIPPVSRRKQPLAGLWLGLRAKVVRSACKAVEGLEGKVIDETRHSVLLDTGDGRKRVPKKNTLFFFPETGASFEGSAHVMPPENKLKR